MTRSHASPLSFLRCRRGAAAAEMALLASVLVLTLANVVDLAMYATRRIQVEAAAQAGVQAAKALCGPLQTPVTTRCAGVGGAILTAVQSTTLGTGVTLQAGSPAEGFYCVDSGSQLQYVAAVSAPGGTTCSTYGGSEAPGDYVSVAVTYTYTPLFTAAPVTVAALLSGPITRTAWYRAE